MNLTKFVLVVSVLAYWNGVDSAHIVSKRDLKELRTELDSSTPPVNVVEVLRLIVRLTILNVLNILRGIVPSQIMDILETIVHRIFNDTAIKSDSGISKRAAGDEFSFFGLFPSPSSILENMASQMLKPLHLAINSTLTKVSNELMLLYKPEDSEGFITPIVQSVINKTVLKVVEIIANIQEQIAVYFKNLTASFFTRFLPILEPRHRLDGTDGANATAFVDSNSNAASDNNNGTDLPSESNLETFVSSLELIIAAWIKLLFNFIIGLVPTGLKNSIISAINFCKYVFG